MVFRAEAQGAALGGKLEVGKGVAWLLLKDLRCAGTRQGQHSPLALPECSWLPSPPHRSSVFPLPCISDLVI